MQIKFSSPPTTKTTQVEAKSVEQPTYHQLLNYRKSALAANLDKYPNGYLVISSIGIRLPIYNRANDKKKYLNFKNLIIFKTQIFFIY